MRIPINYLIYLIDTRYKNLFDVCFETGDISEYSSEGIIISDKNRFISYKIDFSNEIIFYDLSYVKTLQFRFKIKDENRFLYITKSIKNYRYKSLCLDGCPDGSGDYIIVGGEIPEVDLDYEILSGDSKFYNLECPLLDRLLK